MAARKNQFGAFGGVFTPSILTILGVIMYLRLPWLLGQGGLVLGIGIILAAHVVSVTTGLSISSIATDKKVGAGGPYYIISRSLGLPIGGTLGFALFIGLSFSISLYIIGFTESFLDVAASLGFTWFGYEIEPTGTNIRLCGTITLMVLTAVTLISTSLALKTQYIVFGLIILSLVSIFAGSGETATFLTQGAPAEPLLKPNAEAPPMAVLFGIFFPAVTGFTAGVNMSGDLKDPKRAIPRGTMAAIAVGLATYLALAIFLAFRVSRDALVGDPQILTKIALWPWAVVAGIWGATLSSALGSILGAPRILQALSADRVFFRFFAKGAGPSAEPRRALLLAFVIAEGGILIGELNAIANIVSMFFMAMYGVLNLACALEIWASSDFRPDFRISKWWGIVGSVTTLILMINLDIVYALATVLIFIAVYATLRRRELQLEGGDAWEGVWSSIVRSGLQRLAATERQQRHWRPNILAFAPPATGKAEQVEQSPLIRFGATLVRERGVLTQVEIDRGGRRTQEKPTELDGVFHRHIGAEDRYQAIEGTLRHHGFAGMQPNAVLLDFDEHHKNPVAFASVLRSCADLDFNLLMLHGDAHADQDPQRAEPKTDGRTPESKGKSEGKGKADGKAKGEGSNKAKGEGKKRGAKRVDIWWTSDRGSIPFSLSLIRFLTQDDAFRDARVRFLFLTDENARADNLIRETERLLADARLPAQVKILDGSLGDRKFEDWVRKESADAALTMLGVPRKMENDEADAWFKKTDELLRHLGRTLLIRGSSNFRESFVGQNQKRSAPAVSSEAIPQSEEDLPALILPTTDDIAVEVRGFTQAHSAIMETFFEGALEEAYLNIAGLAEQVSGLVHREYSQLAKGLAKTDAPRHRRAVIKARSSLLFQSRKVLDDFCNEKLVAQGDALERRTEVALEELNKLGGSGSEKLYILREASAFVAAPEDEKAVVRFKRGRRVARFFRRQTMAYPARVGLLRSWYLGPESEALLEALLQDCALECFQGLRELSKALEAVRRDLATLSLAARQPEGLNEEAIAEKRDRALQELAHIVDLALERKMLARHEARREMRRLDQAFADDLDRLDVNHFAKRHRKKRTAAHKQRTQKLQVLPTAWTTNQALLIRRIELMILNASFQLRLGGIVQKTHESLMLQIEGGALREGEALLAWLKQAKESDDRENAELPKPPADQRRIFDEKQLIDDLLREVQAASAELPEEIEALSDESLSLLAVAPFDEPEVLTLSLRRMVEFLVGIELLQNLQREIAGIPDAEQRLIGVVQDVVRLAAFHLGDENTAEGEDQEEASQAWRDILDGSISRLETEFAPLREITSHLEDTLADLLSTIGDRTDAYAIAGSEESLKPYLASDEAGQRALNVLERGYRRVEDRAKAALVSLWYRRSEGQLYARRVSQSTGHQETVLARLHQLVDEVSPPAEVLDALPFHYQQLFLRQARIGSEFWVGREQELDAVRSALKRHDEGARGAIFVTGERHAGKSALCRQVCQRCLPRGHDAFHIFGPVGGSPDRKRLRMRLGSELVQQGSVHDILRATPDGTAIVLHDFELWWERTPAGSEAVDVLLEAIDRHDSRLLFIINMSTPAFKLLHRLRPIADHALAVVECEAMNAEALKEVIGRRHRSTALSYRLDGKEEEDLASWAEARLFTGYFDHSSGRVGTAMQTWISNIERVRGDHLQMRRPRPVDSDVLDELRPEWTALLIELALHKQLTVPRLERLAEQGLTALRLDLRALQRSGLITVAHGDVLEINRFAHHLVLQHLRERGVIP